MAIRMHATHPSTPLRRPGAGRRLTASPQAAATNWREQLPVLVGGGMILRQLRQSDAAPLFMLLTTEEVARFITPPPTTLDGFEQFVARALDRQRQGQSMFLAVVPSGSDSPVGLFQVRALENGFATAEWGFALGSPYWGSGLFAEGAALTQRFAFATLGVQRLEARSMVENARGNGALRKVGATTEGVLRQAFEKNGRRHDQYLWSIMADEWRESNGVLVPDCQDDSTRDTSRRAALDPQGERDGVSLWTEAPAPIIVRVH